MMLMMIMMMMMVVVMMVMMMTMLIVMMMIMIMTIAYRYTRWGHSRREATPSADGTVLYDIEFFIKTIMIIFIITIIAIIIITIIITIILAIIIITITTIAIITIILAIIATVPTLRELLRSEHCEVIVEEGPSIHTRQCHPTALLRQSAQLVRHPALRDLSSGHVGHRVRPLIHDILHQ